MSTGRAGLQAEINVTPMIDVLLVLLILFMVMTPLTPKGLAAMVTHPELTPPRQRMPEPNVVLTIAKDKSIRLNGLAVQEVELPRRLASIFSDRSERTLYLDGDGSLEYRQVAHLIDVAKGADPSLQIGLVTSATAN